VLVLQTTGFLARFSKEKGGIPPGKVNCPVPRPIRGLVGPEGRPRCEGGRLLQQPTAMVRVLGHPSVPGFVGAAEETMQRSQGRNLPKRTSFTLNAKETHVLVPLIEQPMGK
jgi:hypothetical protein